MSIIQIQRTQLASDVTANWSSVNPILALGEIGYETDGSYPKIKIGDGVTAWNSLTKGLCPVQGPGSSQAFATGSFSATTGNFIDATDAISSTSAALKTAGGFAAAKAIFAGTYIQTPTLTTSEIRTRINGAAQLFKNYAGTEIASLSEAGNFKINGLAGTGTRHVVVDANGVLSAP